MFRRVFCYIYQCLDIPQCRYSIPIWHTFWHIIWDYIGHIFWHLFSLLCNILSDMLWSDISFDNIWQYLTIYIWHMFWHCKSGFLSGILSVVFESGEVSNKLATKPAMTCGPSPLTIRSAAQLCSNGFEWTHSIFASEGPMTFSLQGLQGFQPIPTLEGAVPLHKWQLLSELGVKLHGHRIILHPNCTPPRAGLTGR